VRQRRDVGSNIPPYRRYAVPCPDSSIDSAVLRGLDRAVATEDPDSQRIFMRLSSEQVKGVYGHQRGEVLSSRGRSPRSKRCPSARTGTASSSWRRAS
jgi:hypothetical protein